jgi:hypothetical protein
MMRFMLRVPLAVNLDMRAAVGVTQNRELMKWRTHFVKIFVKITALLYS